MTLQFEPIRIEKQREYRKYTSVCPQMTSDYSFVNLWGWAEEYGLCWAWDQNLVWILQTQPEMSYWAPIGPWKSIKWEMIFNEYHFESERFTRVPEMLIRYWEQMFSDRRPASFQEERGHWDYLYDIKELVQLKGKRFHKKKNLLNQFKRKYDYHYQPMGPETTVQAMGMQTDWCTWRDCESSDILSSENRVIEKIFTSWEYLEGLKGGSIAVDGEIVAYTVAEQLTDDTLLIHFEKGDPSFKGSYQAINQMFLAHSGENFSTVNREQDLDDDNLRKTKLSYHPSGFLKKYKVYIPKNNSSRDL